MAKMKNRTHAAPKVVSGLANLDVLKARIQAGSSQAVEGVPEVVSEAPKLSIAEHTIINMVRIRFPGKLDAMGDDEILDVYRVWDMSDDKDDFDSLLAWLLPEPNGELVNNIVADAITESPRQTKVISEKNGQPIVDFVTNLENDLLTEAEFEEQSNHIPEEVVPDELHIFNEDGTHKGQIDDPSLPENEEEKTHNFNVKDEAEYEENVLEEHEVNASAPYDDRVLMGEEKDEGQKRRDAAAEELFAQPAAYEKIHEFDDVVAHPASLTVEAGGPDWLREHDLVEVVSEDTSDENDESEDPLDDLSHKAIFPALVDTLSKRRDSELKRRMQDALMFLYSHRMPSEDAIAIELSHANKNLDRLINLYFALDVTVKATDIEGLKMSDKQVTFGSTKRTYTMTDMDMGSVRAMMRIKSLLDSEEKGKELAVQLEKFKGEMAILLRNFNALKAEADSAASKLREAEAKPKIVPFGFNADQQTIFIRWSVGVKGKDTKMFVYLSVDEATPNFNLATDLAPADTTIKLHRFVRTRDISKALKFASVADAKATIARLIKGHAKIGNEKITKITLSALNSAKVVSLHELAQ